MVMFLVISEVDGEEVVYAYLHVSQKHRRSYSQDIPGVSSSQLAFTIEDTIVTVTSAS